MGFLHRNHGRGLGGSGGQRGPQGLLSPRIPPAGRTVGAPPEPLL